MISLIVVRRVVVAGACVAGAAASATAVRAQQPDSSKCDSVVFAARRDSVKSGLYLSVLTPELETTREYRIAAARAIATSFTPPRPFRLSVFSGPPVMRGFRRAAADTAELRAPTVTGVYRFTSPQSGDSTLKPEILRASLMTGFDSAAIDAIRAAVSLRDLFGPQPGVAPFALEVRIATDSTPDAIKIVEAWFPRMLVRDAKPRPDNRVPKLPFDVMENDSSRRHDVLLRFVVDRSGLPALETIEVLRGRIDWVMREAITALPGQRFTPATIAGCPVAQLVEYPFTFAGPPGGPPRH